MPALTTIKLRRGTAAAWISANPTLAAGEPGLESDTGKWKWGDGATAWNSLAYVAGGSTGFATPAVALGTAAAPGSATTGIRSDATLVAFDGTNPVTQALGDAAATGSAAVAARRDHKHGMPALSTATPLVESGAGAVGTSTLSSREDHVHPAAGGSGSLEVKEADGAPDVTGVTQIIVSNGTLTDNGGGSVSLATGGGGGGGGGVLGAISYSSGANGAWHSTNSSTLSDIDATNASLAITVPASGNIVVMIQGEFYETVAGGQFLIGLRTGSTTLATRTTPMSATSVAPPSVGANYGNFSPYWFYLTGLTPGALTIKAAWAASGSGGATVNVAAYDGASGHDNPFVMVAYAA